MVIYSLTGVLGVDPSSEVISESFSGFLGATLQVSYRTRPPICAFKIPKEHALHVILVVDGVLQKFIEPQSCRLPQHEWEISGCDQAVSAFGDAASLEEIL